MYVGTQMYMYILHVDLCNVSKFTSVKLIRQKQHSILAICNRRTINRQLDTL